ncbi:MAG: sporulation protein YunB [Oscillospiraceae bacterium]|nr:sporulation protein YunB [Oscillospiraceae bacterium]
MRTRFRRRYYSVASKKKLFKLFVCLLLAATAALMTDAKIRPQIRALSASRAVVLAENTINQAVRDVLSAGSINYGELVTVDKDRDGQVTAVKTDALKINLLKAELCAEIERRLSDFTRYDIEVPFGLVTGVDSLAGRGPSIHVKVSMTGYANCNISNDFLSAGINQTLHRMMLDIKTGVYVQLPDYSGFTEVETRFCLSETVIVGNVPGFYGN